MDLIHNAAQLTKYEKKVNDTIVELITPLKDKLTVNLESNNHGTTWEIKPKNPRAAKMFIYGVEGATIHITVDDKYWLEMFMNEKEYKDNLPYFAGHVGAILNGRIAGWHVKHEESEDSLGEKTIFEAYVDGTKPHRWTGNILFSGRFKKRKDVIEHQYESY